jgi:hypothetical protein
MTLAEALEITRIHHVVSRNGDRTAFVTTRLLRVLHHMLVEVWLSGSGRMPMPWRTEEASRQPLATLAYRRRLASFLASVPPCRMRSAVDLSSPRLRLMMGMLIRGSGDAVGLVGMEFWHLGMISSCTGSAHEWWTVATLDTQEMLYGSRRRLKGALTRSQSHPVLYRGTGWCAPLKRLTRPRPRWLPDASWPRSHRCEASPGHC